MNVDRLIDELKKASDEGYGKREVVIPNPPRGSYAVTDVEAKEDDYLVRLR